MKATEERKQQIRAAYRKRYSNPECRKRIITENAAYIKAHPEIDRAKALRWRNQNLKKARRTERKWRRSPAGRKWTQARDHARRAAKLAVTVNPRSISGFIQSVRSKKTVLCYYCLHNTPGKTAHFDHIVPLSKGGPHSIENLCVACPKCNQTKSNKPIQEWMRLGQQILAL